jgi:hypothetical protein
MVNVKTKNTGQNPNYNIDGAEVDNNLDTQ